VGGGTGGEERILRSLPARPGDGVLCGPVPEGEQAGEGSRTHLSHVPAGPTMRAGSATPACSIRSRQSRQWQQASAAPHRPLAPACAPSPPLPPPPHYPPPLSRMGACMRHPCGRCGLSLPHCAQSLNGIPPPPPHAQAASSAPRPASTPARASSARGPRATRPRWRSAPPRSPCPGPTCGRPPRWGLLARCTAVLLDWVGCGGDGLGWCGTSGEGCSVNIYVGATMPPCPLHHVHPPCTCRPIPLSRCPAVHGHGRPGALPLVRDHAGPARLVERLPAVRAPGRRGRPRGVLLVPAGRRAGRKHLAVLGLGVSWRAGGWGCELAAPPPWRPPAHTHGRPGPRTPPQHMPAAGD
jgi:hypothetical protein